MSLKIKKIALDNFRGYSHFEIENIPNLTIIVGENAVGKTNIVEAIELLTSGVSFRKPSWKETVSWNCDSAHAEIFMEDGKRQVKHEMDIEGNERKYAVNDKPKRVSSVRGTLPCVLFTPDDLQLVKASSSRRRDAIDALGTQLSKNYSSLKSNYQLALRQRNLLIKEEIHDGALFESWDESLAVHGSRLCLNRWRLFNRLCVHMKRIYHEISQNESFELVYIPSWMRFDSEMRQIGDIPEICEGIQGEEMNLASIQQKISEYSSMLASSEIRRKTSLIGPHKDEMTFFINGKNARMFASQGQQRTIVLALKLAAVELVNEMMQEEPVLLLDDVMSELDEKHRIALTGFLERGAQAFITTTNLGYFSEELLKRAKVVNVPIQGTRYEY